MAVKHIPTQEVHVGSKGVTTGCGTDTNKLSTHWQNTSERVSRKNGCN